MKQIKLTQGKVSLVGDVDFKILSQFKWYARQNANTWYALRNFSLSPGKEISIQMHREILGLKYGDGKITDHINGDGLDNRRGNLRICTKHQNSFNQKPIGGTSKLKGVSGLRQSNRWRARIGYKYKIIHLGYFNSDIEAAKAYDRAAREIFGEFAFLNFPKIRLS